VHQVEKHTEIQYYDVPRHDHGLSGRTSRICTGAFGASAYTRRMETRHRWKKRIVPIRGHDGKWDSSMMCRRPTCTRIHGSEVCRRRTGPAEGEPVSRHTQPLSHHSPVPKILENWFRGRKFGVISVRGNSSGRRKRDRAGDQDS